MPLHQCEVMLKDIGDSKRINTQLHNPDGGSDELQVAAFPVNSVILSAQFWPQLRNETLKLPQEVIQAMEVYTKAYQVGYTLLSQYSIVSHLCRHASQTEPWSGSLILGLLTLTWRLETRS